jgi:cytidine deaminase
VNTITSMVSRGCKTFRLMLIAAERERFTPCGACMDWIMQFAANEDVLILIQARTNGEHKIFRARELMPYYPY